MSADGSSHNSAPPLSLSLNFRLSAMMFLQYAIWGAWLPILLPYLSGHIKLTGDQIGSIFAIGAVGAIIGPFVAGQIADRWFNSEWFLAISHILGGVLVWQLCWIDDYQNFLIFSLLYSIVYAPTLSLTNSLAFHHIPDRERDFGRVRVWGTVGWIVASIAMGHWLLHQHSPAGVAGEELQAAWNAGRADAFRLSAILGVLMGIYCLILPKTPPQQGESKNASLEALGEIRRNPLLTLFLLAVPISCVHQFYFYHTAAFLSTYQAKIGDITGPINAIFGVGGGGLMAIGQVVEIFVLAAIPVVAKKVSRKSFLAVGIIAYGLRMFLFAYVEVIPLPEFVTLIAGVALHGFCFGCFIFVAFMIVDEETTGDVRASAQSLFNLVIIGIGIIVGSMIAARVAAWATTDKVMDYQKLFSVPMWASLACLVALLVCYPGGRRKAT